MKIVQHLGAQQGHSSIFFSRTVAMDEDWVGPRWK